MLRVRETARGVSPSAFPTLSKTSGRLRGLRLGAYATLGLMLGAGIAVFGVSMVQAEDEGSARLFHRQEAARREAVAVQYASTGRAAVYAPPAQPSWIQRIFGQHPDGRLTEPRVVLNPFADQRRVVRPHGEQPTRRKTASASAAVSDTGVSDRDRTFCVRLCDGFHAPIGYLQASADVRAHEALCQAANPGLPVKVFRLAAGRSAIQDAVSVDGRSTYGALPMAFSHEKKGDAACRPAIVRADEHRVSILRDFTLRPGDSVVLDGKVMTFNGGRWPYSPRDFEDFRTTAELGKTARREIDQKVGISRAEAQIASMRRSLRLRQASLRDEPTAEAPVLRGLVGSDARGGSIRIVEIATPRP